MSADRRISLASGVLPEHTAPVVARAAIAAGYSDAGLMIRPDEWQVAWEDELLVHKTEGLGYLDVEVLWIPEGGLLEAGHKMIVDVGKRLGADNLLVVSDEADPELLGPALSTISDWCDGELAPSLEFLRITSVQSLAQARELLEQCGNHSFGILIDTLHLARSGELSSGLTLDPAQHPYIQLCDGQLACEEDFDSLLQDALDGRMAPGESELDLGIVLDELPQDVPLSLEVRSAWYRDHYPDPAERARKIYEETTKFLKRRQTNA